MPVVDQISGAFNKFLPQKKEGVAVPLATSSGGIGHGAAAFDDEMPISKPAIVFHTLQIFFTFLAMCCFANLAAFQAKWKIGPSGLSGFAIFVAVTSVLLSLFLLLVPVIYDKTGKVARLARALTEVRVMFILEGTGVIWSLLISFITTISAWTQAGCKDVNKDPHASLGDSFKVGLAGWCQTKKAGAIFFWMAFAAWVASLIVGIMEWRSGKKNRPRDPPFSHPADPSEDDAVSVNTGYGPVGRDTRQDYAHHEEEYDHEAEGPFSDRAQLHSPYDDVAHGPGSGALPPPGLGGGRQSMDAYGAFSDPAPMGYGAPPVPPGMSRTMAYADPYAALRASIQTGTHSGRNSTSPPINDVPPSIPMPVMPGPPTYSTYRV
ncbi:hypothetical protein BOTBODRAFT_32748 [Botryobasidium botryosum FD-172 SS1]|uniref:MARVEL domain-containing protein n=1 Tax=Botryobasidium botryosum (strain FD-172 SS1) TaxID=930990 RepID=A0A067MHT3_BOTB1|nr:hypothetical protein BOTBODRAFT_32748 [Botryobasidium botryosum FD-172 SS1]